MLELWRRLLKFLSSLYIFLNSFSCVVQCASIGEPQRQSSTAPKVAQFHGEEQKLSKELMIRLISLLLSQPQLAGLIAEVVAQSHP